MPRPRALILGVALALHAPLCMVTVALAQPQNKASAEALFDQARQLLREGRNEEACPRLEESQKLDPGVGTLLHLAECYERVGKAASAWATWREAAALARSTGQAPREQLAQQKAAALQPRLVRLAVLVPTEARVPGLVVLHNGAPLPPERWDVDLPVDPGPHTLEARAPDRLPFTTTRRLSEPGVERLVIPLLAPSPAAPSPSAAPALASSAPASSPPLAASAPPSHQATGGLGPRRQVALGLGALGAVALGTGAYFGFRALSLRDQARPYCDADNTCDPAGIEARSDAIRAGNLSTLLVGAGLLAAGAGVTLWLTAPAARTAIQLGPTGVAVRGAF